MKMVHAALAGGPVVGILAGMAFVSASNQSGENRARITRDEEVQSTRVMPSSAKRTIDVAREPAEEEGSERDDPASAAEKVQNRADGGRDSLVEHEPVSARAEDHRALLDSVITEQSIDPKWSYQTEALVRDALAGLLADAGAGVAIRNIKCRTTLCRAEIDTAEEASYDAAFSRVLHSFFWDGPMFCSRDQSSGQSKLVVFMAKERTALPGG